MTQIATGNTIPGILTLMKYSPETAAPLNALAETLLRPAIGTPGLSRGERELIFGVSSYINRCQFCARVHLACAAIELGENGQSIVDGVLAGGPCSLMDTNPKLHELLHLAVATTLEAQATEQITETIRLAKAAGATDRDIHDTVLIASSANMFNRYVDALDVEEPSNEGFYRETAAMLTSKGYTAATSMF